jgi:outer membrane protein assembly factor BamB
VARRPKSFITLALAASALAAGGYAAAATGASQRAGAHASAAAAPTLTNWPEFGLNPQRTDATDAGTAITAANVGRLRLRTVDLPGTADNSAIYIHQALVGGARHDTAIVTTDYGITLAIDAASGRILWRFVPPKIASWQGSAQITTASPILDPSGAYVYAASPDGRIHKLSVSAGREQAGWPVRVTPAPRTEKLTASLNIADGDLLATTGGYYGDAPPYVGHIVAISLTAGKIEHVFNTLCANRTTVIDPASCPASDSAILSRSGPVVEPGAQRVLIATGNAPYNGTTDFGDSVIELTLPGLKLRQAYTPTDQAKLNTGDLDLGSGSPALLPGNLAWIAGKDGIQRVLNLAALDGSAPGSPPHTGGELQTLPTPGGQQIFTTPAVGDGRVFVADDGGTSAYRVSGRRLRLAWQNSTPGTSPVLAGGLLYVYDPAGSGISVYAPASGRRITTLAVPGGHWNSPIVVDGHVIEPTGDDNQHRLSGSLVIYSIR